jgi:hypothetical protein
MGSRHPLLVDCWCAMDGLKLYFQQAEHAIIQERFYNGWMHDHYVTSVFCFCPDETIPIAFLNVLGSAELGNICGKLESVFEATRGKCCVDSAFGNVSREYLYKSSQDLFESLAPTVVEKRMEDFEQMWQATSAQQTSEWGMLSMQTSFPWLCDRFHYKECGKRQIILKMMVLLFNLRARMVGINHIRNTYMRHLTHNAMEDVWF